MASGRSQVAMPLPWCTCDGVLWHSWCMASHALLCDTSRHYGPPDRLARAWQGQDECVPGMCIGVPLRLLWHHCRLAGLAMVLQVAESLRGRLQASEPGLLVGVLAEPLLIADVVYVGTASVSKTLEAGEARQPE